MDRASDVQHKSIRVHGKVQGVFFRANTGAVARTHNLTGFVRNEPDGSVYIEAEGSPEALQQLVTWCNSGPSRAQVERCTVVDGPVVGYTTFDVQR